MKPQQNPLPAADIRPEPPIIEDERARLDANVAGNSPHARPSPSVSGYPLQRNYSVEESELITYSWKNVDVWVGKRGAENILQSPRVSPLHDTLDGRTVKDVKWETESEVRRTGQTALPMPTPQQSDQAKKWKCPWKPNAYPAKHLVNNVSGIVKPGELVALMGASGAGKTTLLNVLTYRSGSQLNVSGERFINGVKVGPKEVSAVSAYIQQEDLFFGSLTVFEHLVFYSHLRMDKKYSKTDRMARVLEVMDEFGLTKCKDTKIGIHGRVKGISGGEMKRLAFASEILSNPQLMFCDEPTSGLDSYMAETVVSVMQGLAFRGKTIICTIHQPSSQVFAMFDRIMLLAEGRTVFLGSVAQCVEFFAAHGHVCPPNFNPADFFARTLAIVPGKVDDCKKFVNFICDEFQGTPDNINMMAELNKPAVIDAAYEKKLALYTQKSPYKVNWFSMFRTVVWRSWISIIHDPMVIAIRLVQIIMLSLIIGGVFWDTQIDTSVIEYSHLSDVAGVLYLLIANISLLNMFAVLDGFLGEVPIFLREHFSGMYRVDVYFLSRMLTDLPFFVLFPLIFHCITYAMIQFQWAWTPFLYQGLVLILVAQTSTSFAYFLSCICKSLIVALSIGPGMLIPLMLFSGFFIKTPNMQIWNSWITNISWFYYAVEAMMTNQLEDVTKIDCKFSLDPSRLGKDKGGFQPFFNCTPIFTGKAFLTAYDFKEDEFGFNIGILCLMSVILRIFAFIALLMKTLRSP